MRIVIAIQGLLLFIGGFVGTTVHDTYYNALQHAAVTDARVNGLKEELTYCKTVAQYCNDGYITCAAHQSAVEMELKLFSGYLRSKLP